jgi:hypothetical protein
MTARANFWGRVFCFNTLYTKHISYAVPGGDDPVSARCTVTDRHLQRFCLPLGCLSDNDIAYQIINDAPAATCDFRCDKQVCTYCGYGSSRTFIILLASFSTIGRAHIIQNKQEEDTHLSLTQHHL